MLASVAHSDTMNTFDDLKQRGPRVLTFAGSLRKDFKLLEVSEDLLAEIKATGYGTKSDAF